MEEFIPDAAPEVNSEDESIPNRRGKAFVWDFVETMSVEQAAAYIDQRINSDAVKGRTNTGDDVLRKYLYCAWNMRSNCKKQWILEYPSTSPDVHLYENDEKHTHDESIPRPANESGLPPALKDVVISCLGRGVRKPLRIITEIRKTVAPQDEPPRMREKIVNFIQYYNRTHFGSSNPSIADIANFVREHQHEPDQLNNLEQETYFVIGFDAPDENGPDNLPKFRLVFSSRRLLQHVPAEQYVQIQADATYKLIWQGFPVFVVGTSDANKKFHPTCIAVCSHEAEDDFRFTFDALKRWIPELEPQFCLAHGANAIFNGAKAVWPAITRIMCNSHVYMNCKKRCNSIRDAHARDEMLKDIKLIQLSPTEAHFTSAVDAFKQEYEGKGEEFHQFVQYFEEQWVNAVPCWYEGMHLDEVMNNCGIEGTNKAIKEDGT
jgi:hypothetical protein